MTPPGQLQCARCAEPFDASGQFCPMCGAPRHRAAASSLVGQVIAERYLLLEQLDVSPSGSSYLAEHLQLHRNVVVKVLPETANRVAVERMRREALHVGKVKNEHLVEVFDFGSTRDGALYLVTEHLDGQPLAKVLEKRGMLGVKEVVDIVRQVAEALVEPHAAGLVHRDLRPATIYLIDRGGPHPFVKLADFGLAKLVESNRAPGNPASRVAATFGDWRYVSPEQVRQQPVDSRADLFSIGLVAYEMLVGKLPASTVPPAAMDQIPAVSSERPGVPPWLNALVARLLAREPTDRVPSVEALVRELERTSGNNPDGRTRKIRAAKMWSRPVVSGGLAAALLAVLAVIAIATTGSDDEGAARPRAGADAAPARATAPALPDAAALGTAPPPQAPPDPDPSPIRPKDLFAEPPASVIDERTLPEITYKTDTQSEYWDLAFLLRVADCRDEGACQLVAYGVFEGRIVGFAIEIEAGLKPPRKFSGGPARPVFVDEGIALRSLGEPSDQLLAAMANLYGTKMPARPMKPRVAFRAAATDGNPAAVEREPVQYKISYENPNVFGELAELILQVDIPRRELQILEKDTRSRKNVIKALSHP